MCDHRNDERGCIVVVVTDEHNRTVTFIGLSITSVRIVTIF